MQVLSVTQVNHYVRALMDADDLLREVWVQGEVSNLKRANSGYVYFSLKDGNAQLRCALFKRLPQAESLRDGAFIQAHGRVTLYIDKGDCQLYVDDLRLSNSVGDLYEQFEGLKRKLEAEGLFDTARKRPMPAFPRRIGVVTSADAAAWRDVQNVLGRRFPLAHVLLSHTLVQGNDAPAHIVRALQRAVRAGVDAILLCRGGGSMEDLWCFNDERVARAIVACPVPVISGVGHETDFTIADFVADLRAPTPSAAAELLTPNVQDLRAELAFFQRELADLIRDGLSQRNASLSQLGRALAHQSPQRTLADMRQRLDTVHERLQAAPTRLLAQWRERVAAKAETLEAVSPQAVLARGYAIIKRKSDGKAITRPKDAPPGTAITLQTKDGKLHARTEEEGTHERYDKTLF